MNVVFKRGDRIEVLNDSIFSIMGLGPRVTGTVFSVGENGQVRGIQCDQTGHIECLDDGAINIISEENL